MHRQIGPQYPHLRVEGSTGRRNVTAAPWIAAIDPRITRSATRGYYVVYLFSVDLAKVFLTLVRIPVIVIAGSGIVISDSADREHAVGAKRR